MAKLERNLKTLQIVPITLCCVYGHVMAASNNSESHIQGTNSTRDADDERNCRYTVHEIIRHHEETAVVYFRHYSIELHQSAHTSVALSVSFICKTNLRIAIELSTVCQR
jgi:hypothetical protein